MKQPPKNIMIYRLGSLGDTVIALPCFNRIKQCFPDADITLLTNKPVSSKAAPLESILGSDYFYNRTLSYPVGTRNPFVINKLIREIRKLNINTLINITALRTKNTDIRDRLFFQAAGISEFIGFDQLPEDYEIAVDPITGEHEWEALRLKRKIQALGEFNLDDEDYWDLHLTDEELEKAEKALEPIGYHSKMIAISPGTKMAVKDWGRKAWTQLVTSLAPKYGDYALAVIGSGEEAVLAAEYLKIWPGQTINLCGKCSPRVSAAILRRATLFIGHDSGPTHLAACVGTPCVVIYSCINMPRQWYPRGDENHVIFPDTDCAQNGLNRCINPDDKCIHTIDPAIVEAAVDNAILKTIKT